MNKEFEEKKRALMNGQKEKQILEASQRLSQVKCVPTPVSGIGVSPFDRGQPMQYMPIFNPPSLESPF
jgi:hypothetical protein